MTARDLHRHYRIRRHVLSRPAILKAVNGVDLDLSRGETLGIVGESGCGKSTLAQMLVGMERPTSGSIELFGRKLHAMGNRDLRRTRQVIQLVHQDPYSSLDPRMTIEQIVREPLDVHRQGSRTRRRRIVLDLLDRVGLNPDHAGRRPRQLSGGQRQRVDIARALALSPQVIVCDEPVSALDVSVQAQIVNLLADLQRDLGLAMVFISHDLGVVQHVADRVMVMYLGEIVEHGRCEEVYDRPRHPYTVALLAAVPKPDRASRHADQAPVLMGEPPSALTLPSGCPFRPRCPYAQDRCSDDAPRLRPLAPPSHKVACHYPVD